MAPEMGEMLWLANTGSWYTGDGVNSLARVVALLCLAACLPAQSPLRTLEPGKPLDHDIQRGEIHIYELQAGAGQYLNALITPRQTDLKTTLTSPDGQQVVTLDALSSQGPEEIAWILGAPGRYRITLQIKDTGAASGRYTLALRSLGGLSGEDRLRAAGFKTFTAAEILAAQANVKARKLATVKYDESLSSWRTTGDLFWEARVLHQMAFNWEALGELIKARDALLAALPLRRASGNRIGEANTLNNLGLVYNNLGEPAMALEYLSPALDIRRETGNRRGEAATLNNIASAYARMDDPTRAIDVLLRSLEIRRELGDRLGEAIVLNNLGVHYSNIGDFQRGLDRLLEALAYRREMGDRRGEGAGLTNIGVAYRALGETKKAHDYFIQAAAVFEAVGDRRGLAATLSSLGTLGNPQDALTYLARSLSIRREIGDRQGEVTTLASMSAAQLKMGNHRKASESAEDGLDLARKIAFHRGEGQSLFHAANADRKLGNRAQAQSRLKEAIAIFQTGRNRQLESMALTTLGEEQLSAGNLQQALASSRLAVSISESLRGSVTDPELRASFRAHGASRYGLYIDVLMSLHRQTPSGGFDVLAIEASERSRARSLVEILADSRIDLRQTLSPAQRKLEDQIIDRISQAQRELFRSSLPAARRPEVNRQLASAERELDTFQLELRKGDGRYAAVQYAAALDRDQIRRDILGPDTALVEFALGERQSYVWVLTKEGEVSAVLPPRKNIERQVQAYRKELAQGPSALTVRVALARLDGLGAGLYRDLLAPVESAFKSARRLIIVPDGVLSYLPFETLGGDTRLIERFAIGYSPSASALATLRGRFKESAPPAKSLLAFGDPVYSAAGQPAIGISRKRGLDFTQLPYSRTERDTLPFPPG